MKQDKRKQDDSSYQTKSNLTVRINNSGCAQPPTLGTPGPGNPLQPGSDVEFVNLSPTSTFTVADLDTANVDGQNAPLSNKSSLTLEPGGRETITISQSASGRYRYRTPSCPVPPEMIVGG
jgi:hypothetical protein